jgi:hypothetical protein
MLVVKDVDIYVNGKLRLTNVALNYNEFEMESDEPQVVTATAFLPDEGYFANDSEVVIDLKDGVYAKAVIFSSMRLCDENQCEMRVVDAARSLDELL